VVGGDVQDGPGRQPLGEQLGELVDQAQLQAPGVAVDAADVAGQVQVGGVAVDQAAPAGPAAGDGLRDGVAVGDRPAVGAAAQDGPGQPAALEPGGRGDGHLDAGGLRPLERGRLVLHDLGHQPVAQVLAAVAGCQDSQPTVVSTSSTQLV
jgi:hypothetical protein